MNGLSMAAIGVLFQTNVVLFRAVKKGRVIVVPQGKTQGLLAGYQELACCTRFFTKFCEITAQPHIPLE